MSQRIDRALLLSIVLVAATQGALAQEAAPSSDSGVLEEIVITAQRRGENLQTVPIAVTALQGSELAGKAVTSIADLQYSSPSLSIGDSGLTNSVNIRGIGLASGNPNVANGVATYYDGLFQPPIVSTNQFYDIADIEVLRGPQGTLVGSNSTGGAIFINTQNPKIGENDGYIRLGAGNFGDVEADGAINLPVNDVLAFRAAGEYDSRASFYDSVGPVHTDAGSLTEKSGRLSVLFKPGSFQALAKFEYTDRSTGGYGATPEPGTQYAPYAPTDPFQLSYDSPTLNHERGLIAGVELRQELTNGITLRSLTGYQDKNIHNYEDYDGTAENTPGNPQLTYDQYVRERVWTEEINVISPKNNDFNWVVGAYGQRNKIDVDIEETGATGPGGPTLFVYVPQNKTTTGWFGQVNFKFAPQWELQTGLRYSNFKVDGDGFVALELPVFVCGNDAPPAAPFNGCQVGNTGGHESDGRVTGKVALNYTLDELNLLYAFVARGYKSGGFNTPTQHFNPETVLDYELGWKSTLLDGHLRTQLGGFYYKYHNFQFQELNLGNGQSGIDNLPSATIAGIEATLQTHFGGFGADGGLSYVHSHLPSPGAFVDTHILPTNATGEQCATGQTVGCFDYTPYLVTSSGGPNLYSPAWSFNAGADYKFLLGGAVALTPRLNYAYVSGQYTNLTYSEVTDYLPAHGLLSALLTVDVSDFQVQGYTTNLTDKIYRSGQGLNNGNYYFYGAPRQYGVRIQYNFK